VKRLLGRLLPRFAKYAARETYDWLRRLPNVPDAYLHPWRRTSRSRIAALYDCHRDERCFIMGNGPSLRQMDLGRLRGEITFGMNRVYPSFADWGFATTYYVSINDLVVQQCAAEIQALPTTKFIAWHANRFFQRFPEDLIFLYTTYTGPGFQLDMTRRIWEGATVTNVALQLAYYMGIQQVVLIGVDHRFKTSGAPNQTVTSQGDDEDHFSPDYFGKGFRWQLPDLQTSEAGYRLAREAFRRGGREVVDATIGGDLRVFPKVDYNSLFPS